MMKISKHLRIAINASLDAGSAIMDIYDLDFHVDYKKDKSPLTKADRAANTIITKSLKKTEFPIISEENEQEPYDTRKSWDTCWIVDPLDGTKEFIKRNGEFTVNIALIKNGSPYLGVVYIPDTKVLFFADTLEGKAYKVKLDTHRISKSQLENAIPINPLKPEKPEKLRVVASRSHMNKPTSEFVKDISPDGKQVEIITAGSSLKFCLVAEGKADIYPRFAPTMEWDTAAGQCICEAVGVNLISEETGQPLKYNKKNLRNPHFICKAWER